MTARTAGRIASLAAALAVSGCTSFYEVTIETPIQAKLDIAAFPRVLVAGFVTGGTDEVDANLETVRLLRSQLRTKSGIRVIEADVLPLAEIAQDRRAQRRPHPTRQRARPCPPARRRGERASEDQQREGPRAV